MKDKMVGTICLVLSIIVIVSTSTSFAYFNSSVQGSDNDITGNTSNFDVKLDIESVYTSNQLVPLEDSKIVKAVNNKCKDIYGYEVCSLYKITLTNNDEPQILNAYITSGEETTYITENLKGQLLSSDLKKAISNVLTLTDKDEINTEEKRYFHIDDTNLYATEITKTETIYLVVWLTETHDYQTEDYNKDYVGSVVFESIGGDQVTTKITT